MQGLGNAAQHAERMAFIAGRLQAANLLLRGLKEFCQLFLGESGLLAKGSNLQCHVPSLAGVLEAGGKGWVLQLFFKVMVEFGLFHFGSLFCQSCIRSRAVARSRGMGVTRGMGVLKNHFCDSLSPQYLSLHGLIYAFSPIITGFPSTSAVVTAFPRVLATTRVFPDAEGVGFSRSISMQSLLPLISTVIAMWDSPIM